MKQCIRLLFPSALSRITHITYCAGVARIHNNLPAALAQPHRSQSVKHKANNSSSRLLAAEAATDAAKQLVDRHMQPQQLTADHQRHTHQPDQLNQKGNRSHAPTAHLQATHQPAAQINTQQHAPQRKRRHRSPLRSEATEVLAGRPVDADPSSRKPKQKRPREVLASLPDNQQHNTEDSGKFICPQLHLMLLPCLRFMKIYSHEITSSTARQAEDTSM